MGWDLNIVKEMVAVCRLQCRRQGLLGVGIGIAMHVQLAELAAFGN